MVSYNVYVPKLNNNMSLADIDKEKKLCDKRYNELREEMEFVENKGYPTEASLKKAWNAVDKKMGIQIENIKKCLRLKGEINRDKQTLTTIRTKKNNLIKSINQEFKKRNLEKIKMTVQFYFREGEYKLRHSFHKAHIDKTYYKPIGEGYRKLTLTSLFEETLTDIYKKILKGEYTVVKSIKKPPQSKVTKVTKTTSTKSSKKETIEKIKQFMIKYKLKTIELTVTFHITPTTYVTRPVQMTKFSWKNNSRPGNKIHDFEAMSGKTLQGLYKRLLEDKYKKVS